MREALLDKQNPTLTQKLLAIATTPVAGRLLYMLLTFTLNFSPEGSYSHMGWCNLMGEVA